MHHIVVLALDGVTPFDLGIACDAFAHLRGPEGGPLYSVRVCGAARDVRSASFTVRVQYGLEALQGADTVLVPGTWNTAEPPGEQICAALRDAFSRGARIASICTGAFTLAAAGLLDGRRATTHWMAADELARRHPRVEVDRNVLFIDEGPVVTSAGASAGTDMCLHLIGRDHGQAVAAQAARLAVSPLHRDGGQSQFIGHAVPARDLSLAPLLAWMAENVGADLNLDAIAAKARMSSRTLARRFHDQVGTTPIQWLLTARVRRAQELLQSTAMTMDQVAAASGFDSTVTLRARFARVVGLSPTAYRRRFSRAEPSLSAAA